MRKKDSVIWRLVDDEALLLDTVKGDYFCLNKSAAVMWTLLSEGKEPDAVAQSISEKFKINVEMARADVQEFVASLKTNGLME